MRAWSAAPVLGGQALVGDLLGEHVGEHLGGVAAHLLLVQELRGPRRRRRPDLEVVFG